MALESHIEEDDPFAVGVSFVQGYFAQLNKDPETVAKFFASTSSFSFADSNSSSFDRNPSKGQEAIRLKIKSLKCWSDVRTDIQSIDCQSSLNGSVLVVVYGLLGKASNLCVSPRRFMQAFLLAKAKANTKSFFVVNSCFRYLDAEVEVSEVQEEDDEVEVIHEEIAAVAEELQCAEPEEVLEEPEVLVEAPKEEKHSVKTWVHAEVASSWKKAEEVKQQVVVPEEITKEIVAKAPKKEKKQKVQKEVVAQEAVAVPEEAVATLPIQSEEKPVVAPPAVVAPQPRVYVVPTTYAEAINVASGTRAPIVQKRVSSILPGSAQAILAATPTPAPSTLKTGGRGRGQQSGNGRGNASRGNASTGEAPSSSSRSEGNGQQVNRFSVYVARIAPETADEALREAFNKFGAVAQIRNIPLKRIAFVDFSTVEGHSKAIEAGEKGEIIVNGAKLLVQAQDSSAANRGPPRQQRRSEGNQQSTDGPSAEGQQQKREGGRSGNRGAPRGRGERGGNVERRGE